MTHKITMTRNPHKQSMVGRSFLEQARPEQPRTMAVCQACQEEAERLEPVQVGALTVWVCAGCKEKGRK